MSDYSIVSFVPTWGEGIGYDHMFNDICASPDGKYVYASQTSFRRIYRFTLEKPWDMTAQVVSEISPTFPYTPDHPAAPTSVHISPDGLDFFVMSFSSSESSYQLFHYRLSSPFSVSSMTFVRKTLLGLSYILMSPVTGISFSPDGSKMLMLVYDNRIVEYSLSTPWNISTKVEIRTRYTMNTGLSRFWVSPSGGAIYVGTGGDIERFTLSPPFSFEEYYVEEKELSLNSLGFSETITHNWYGLLYSPSRDKCIISGATPDYGGFFSLSTGIVLPVSPFWTNFIGQSETI